MHYKRFAFLTALLAGILILQGTAAFTQQLQYPPAPERWNADSLGNHRAVVTVTGHGKIAKVTIPWRRRDLHPEQKQLIITDGRTGRRVMNVYPASVTREQGILYFEPISGPGTYYIYYLPYRLKGSHNYPTAVYPAPVQTAGADWLQEAKQATAFAGVRFDSLEAADDFNRFGPMEQIATAAEVKSLLSRYNGKAYLVFPEDRMHPVKMEHDLPRRWIVSGAKSIFSGAARRGEYYAFQLGVYPVTHDLQNVRVSFSDLKSVTGKSIAAGMISCINTGGISYKGAPFSIRVDVPQKQVQALWCDISVPEDLPSGLYEGTATVTADNAAPTVVRIRLKVNSRTAVNGGVNEPWKQTRLQWLNSVLAQENTVIAPYAPLEVQRDTISLLGRRLILDAGGLPAQIQTFFTPEMTGLSRTPRNLFTEPVHFHFITEGNKNLKLQKQPPVFTQQSPGTVEWHAENASPALKMEVNGHIEFDGFVAYQVKVIALQDIRFENTQLHLPFRPEAAKYLMGLGRKGGYRPDSIDWKWDVAHKNQDGAWIGDVNAGLQFSLRDERYARPLNTNFYLQKPLVLPTSWGNGNKGGIRIAQKGTAILVDNYSGARMMKKGDTLYYNFNLLITPFHALNTDFQWSHRFYHAYKPVDTVKAAGANVINIHHATFINPYINYPFIAAPQMKAYIDSAHRAGLYVKIYNTVRELSNHAYELYPLRSLGHEVYSTGPGGGFAWLQEHLDGDYIAAWFVPALKDAAIINSGLSRWHNYYVEGMNWLVKNAGIDGIYLDDVAFDRVTMKRIKRVLRQNGHPGIIDLHSANQYNPRDGFNNSANLYMEHFPYLDRLWFGEYFDYENNGPDFFLTEVSGIPFGLMGEMLQDKGNPWRGMLYGMTSRLPWAGDPRPLWKAWDDFGMQGTRMVGYWVADNPVKTNNPDVLATIYKKPGAVMVSVASWAKTDTTVKLEINWKALGIDPAKAVITAPAIHDFQPAATFGTDEAIPVAKNKGWLLIIQ